LILGVLSDKVKKHPPPAPVFMQYMQMFYARFVAFAVPASMRSFIR
jgi:hypothetical protein